jgi:alpha-beta hydrolase superfamily lysophospholipase
MPRLFIKNLIIPGQDLFDGLQENARIRHAAHSAPNKITGMGEQHQRIQPVVESKSAQSMRFIYIHGFASSPRSRKAERFRTALVALGISMEAPEMDQGDFEHLTISGQLKVLDSAVEGQPVCLIGSSMGGLVASLYAAEHVEVAKLVLLAPAFGFASRWQAKYGGSEPAHLDVFHYGDQKIRRVHYRLIEDALRFPDAPDPRQPTLIFHGVNDDVVPVGKSRNFAREHENVRLVELDSDHELLNVTDRIVAEALAFLLK